MNTYVPANQVVARLSRKYGANRVWLWDLLADELNIIKGIGCLMSADEIAALEAIVKGEVTA